MSLQATLVMMDNSASSINGDYQPTRWDGQVDCATLLINAKLQANQQSSVGVGLMGGQQVQILCTLTSDSIKANSFLFGIKSNGHMHFSQSIQIGALALKHRSNQTQKQRMVCFIGSTVSQDIQTLKILAKKLKKNGVAVDIVCFGDCSEQQINKMQTFITTLQNQDNSHCVVVKPGQNLTDLLIASPIIGGQANNAGGFANIEQQDPELAAAIRMSLQQSQQQANSQNNQPIIPVPQASRQPAGEANNIHQPTQEQLQALAIQMSLQQFNLQQQQQQKKDEQQKKQ